MGETTRLPLERLAGQLSGRAGVALCVVVHVALAASSFGSDLFLNEEGVRMHVFASMTAEDFLPAFFLLEARPPSSVVYASLAAQGIEVYWAAHVFVAALAIPLWASVARALEHRFPALVGAVVGLSPLLVAGGAAGVSSTDAVTGLGLFAWLLVARRRRLAAALVLGLVPLIRFELAIFLVLFVARNLQKRGFDVVLGALCVPLLYALAGAFYHRELLWMSYWAPSLAPPILAGHGAVGSSSVVRDGWGAALALTPALGWVAALRWRALVPFERFGVVFGVVFMLVVFMLSRLQLFAFELTALHALPVLPFVALVVSRVVEGWLTGDASPRAAETGVLVLLGGAALWAERTSGSAAALAVVALWAGALAAARWRRPAIALAIVVPLLVAGPFVLTEGAKLDRHARAPYLDDLVALLRHHADGLAVTPVYTNVPLLDIHLVRTGQVPSERVFSIVRADELHRLAVLTNPGNGQRPAIARALRRATRGSAVLLAELDPSTVPPGAFLVLTQESTLPVQPSMDAWDQRLRVVHRGRDATIWVVKEEGDE